MVAAPLVRHQLAVRLHHDRVEVLHSVVLKDIKMPNERAVRLLWVTCEILEVARRSPTLLGGLNIIGGCVNPTLWYGASSFAQPCLILNKERLADDRF